MQANNFRFMMGAVAMLAFMPTTGYSAAAVPNFSIDGIPAPGTPHFYNSVNVKVAKFDTGYKVTASSTASGAASFDYSASTSYNLTGSSFNLTAYFDGTGAFLANSGGNKSTLSINGTLAGYSANPIPGATTPTPDLLTADLVGYGVDNTDNPDSLAAIGFRTQNLGGWSAQFNPGTDESIYLYGLSVDLFTRVLGGDFSFAAPLTFRNASAFTTVPVPAGVWLLGSALALAPWARRKKSEKA